MLARVGGRAGLGTPLGRLVVASWRLRIRRPRIRRNVLIRLRTVRNWWRGRGFETVPVALKDIVLINRLSFRRS